MESLRKIISSTALFMSCSLMYAQDKVTANGTIADEIGSPIASATIMEKGTANGTVTDINSNFSLSINEDVPPTVFYIGYSAAEAKATTKMSIQPKQEANELNKVIITGYTTQRKADLTGAVSVVKTGAVKTFPDADPMKALRGHMAGMTTTDTGSPSSTTTIRIRGIGSFNSSQDPLFIVDGVPVINGISTLNSNDIENIRVLKDAASANIYGSRTANGVVTITTKQEEKADKIKVDFTTSLVAQFYTRQSRMKLFDTKGYATAMAQATLNDGMDSVAYASNYGLNPNAAEDVGIRVWNPTTNQYVGYTINGLYNGFINTRRTMMFSGIDWARKTSRIDSSRNYSVSTPSATDKLTSTLSLGYKKDDSTLKYTNFPSTQARVNNLYRPNNIFKVDENFTISYNKQVDDVPMESALKISPIVFAYEKDDVTFDGPVDGMSDRQNLMRELYRNKDNHLNYQHIFGNIYVDIAPVKGLPFHSNFGVDCATLFISVLTYTFVSGVVNNNIARADLGQTNNTNYTWSNTLSYFFDIKNAHYFNVSLDLEINKQTYLDFHVISGGYVLELVEYVYPNATTGTAHDTDAVAGYRLTSFFGKVDYNYSDLLPTSSALRHGGLSRLGKNDRWGNLLVTSLGFRIPRLLRKNQLDDLRFRLSWGKTDNQGTDNNAHYSLYVTDYSLERTTSTAYDLDPTGSGTFPLGYHAVQTANENLKWKTTTQYSMGIDYSLFRSSLYGTADFYIKNTTDILINPGCLTAKGEGGSQWQNRSSFRDWGMEFTSGYHKNFSSGLGININSNISFFRNRVTSLPKIVTGAYAHTLKQNIVGVKKPYDNIVGYVAGGLFQNHMEVHASGQPNAHIGGLKYVDLNGDGRINQDDQTWIVNPVPTFSYDLNVAVSYKNFDISMLWQGVADQDIYDSQKFQAGFRNITGAGSNRGSRMLNVWTPNNTGSSIPVLTTNNTTDEGHVSTYYVENGSYLKFRTLQLGYNVPKKFISKLKTPSLRAYILGQNLLTLRSSSLTCSGPENPSWAYPLTISVSSGLQVESQR